MDDIVFVYFKKFERASLDDRMFSNLKGLCIAAFVKNFQILAAALDQEENREYKSILQRMYSDVFFHKMKRPLKKIHASFLINRHLRKLDLNYFPMDHIYGILDILKKNGEGIEALHLWEPKIAYFSETFFLELANSLPKSLKRLRLSGIECRDEILKIVTTNCSNLRELNLSDCISLTDDGIKSAFSDKRQPITTSLQKLNLKNTLVTGQGVTYVLDHCPNITEICHKRVGDVLYDMYEYHVDNNILPFRKFNLQVLDVESCNLKACHTICSGIQSLTVTDMNNEEELNICGDFEKLRSINFNFVMPLSLRSFFETRGSNLERVAISGCVSFSLESLAHFCPKIEHLEIGIDNVEMRNTFSINARLLSLQYLKCLIINDVNHESNSRHIDCLISFSPNIETLVLAYSFRLAEILRHFSITNRLSHLRKLCIYMSNIDFFSVKKIIIEVSNLKYLSICYCFNISQNDVEILTRLATKQRIQIELKLNFQ